MKHSQTIGIIATLALVAICFLPWSYIASRQITITGFQAVGTNFGKPGLFTVILSGIMLVMFAVPAIWSKRTNVFIAALNLAWAFRNYLMISTCLTGEHGSTYGGNLLACAVAMTALTVLKEENMAANAELMGELLRAELAKLNSPFITTIRGKGLLNAIVIEHRNPDASWELCLALKENGLLAKPTHGDKIRFAPPLLITREQVLECVEIISRSLQTLV